MTTNHTTGSKNTTATKSTSTGKDSDNKQSGTSGSGTHTGTQGGTHEQHVVSANAVGARAAFQMTNFCSGVASTYDYAPKMPGITDEIDFYYSGMWLTLVDPALTEGHMWPYFNTSYHWHRESSVTVPAGTYDDCWTAVQDVSYTASLTYCRGVGLVHSYSSDLAGSGWDAKLASLTLH